MSLSFSFNPLLLILCALIAGGLTYWTYGRTVPQVTPGRRTVLSILRFLALFIIVFLLFEPILRRTNTETQPPLVAVLVDNSESLSLTGANDLDLSTTVRETLHQLPANQIRGNTQFYQFSNRLHPLEPAAFDSFAFDGSRTDMAQALNRVRDNLEGENLRGIVMISDGQYNTGRNPLYLAERYPVPIYTVAVGDTTEQKDVQIRRVTTNEIAYLETELPVQIGVRAEGYAGETVNVSLFQNGERLDTERIQLPQGTTETPINLSFTPKTEGLQRITATVTRLEGELTYANNSESFTVQVLDSKQKILVLSAAADPDVAALKQILTGDPHMELTTFTQKNATTFFEGSLPNDLSDFSAVILVGYPGRQHNRAVVERVAQAVTDGLPAFFLLSRQTDLNALRQHFGDLLPATPSNVRRGFTEAFFDPTPAGSLHPVLDLPDVSEARLVQLPPLAYNESRWSVAPDARTLATLRIRGIRLNDPLLLIQRRANNRTAMLLGAGTWRWKNVPEDLQDLGAFWPATLSNILQWITTREDNRPVRIRPVQDLFGGGEDVGFTGQVYDESLNPVDRAGVEIKVTAPDGTEYPYPMESVGNGRYVVNVGALPEGTYRYTAEARRNDALLGEDSGTFAVGALTLEFKETRTNASLLRQMARRSGGAFLTAENISEIPTRLANDPQFQPLYIEHEQETELWHFYSLLGLIVLLLTTEWILRKRSGMV